MKSDFPVSDGTENRVVFEAPKRMSQSALWRLQRNFYERQGLDAWKTERVPFHVTTNPFLANAYAGVVLGWLRDWQASGALDLSQPIYIVELGSGTGKLAYHFLKRFFDMLDHSPLKHIRLTYVMTDLAERNIEFWRQHPSLAPYAQAGRVDFARFDAVQDDTLTLLHSGATLSADTVTNPIVLFANYFFDTIPHDIFRIKEGKLHETLLALTASEPEPDREDPELLNRLKAVYQDHPINGDYYDDPILNRILHDYAQRLGNTSFLIPVATLRCLRVFIEISHQRLLLLTADKGFIEEQSLLHRETPEIVLHGSFSMTVNYHAVGQYVHHHGGQQLKALYRYTSPVITAFLLGTEPGDYCETRLAYQEYIVKHGPEDLYALRSPLHDHYPQMTLSQLIAYLRLSGWDPAILTDIYPFLYKQLEQVGESDRQELHYATRQVWDTFFHIGEQPDLPFLLGLLLQRIDCYPEAIEFFEHSLRLYGPHPATLYNMALCHYQLRQLDAALDCAKRTLEADSNHAMARAMLVTLEAEIELRRRGLPAPAPVPEKKRR